MTSISSAISTNAANWVAEEMAWQALKAQMGADAHIYYRHRARNSGRKAGNIQDFCENWGRLYDYMVILDADSLMTGKALNTLVGLMDANPRVGLIQAPPQLVAAPRCLRACSSSPPVSMVRCRPRAWPGCRMPTATIGATTPSYGCMPSCSVAPCPACRGTRPSAARS